MHKPSHTVHLDGVLSHLWQASKNLLETAVIPLGLFYVLFTYTGLTGGLFAALGWSLAALTCRLVLRARIPMVLLLTTGVLVVRTALGFATGSSFVYLLEPSLRNFLIALAFLVTLPFERTFIAKLADDFCAFPPALTGNARVQGFFRRVSVLWAMVFILNGVMTLWVLAQATVGAFLLVSTVGSWTVIGSAVVVSLLWFRRELRGEGIQLRFGAQPATA